MHRGNDKNFSKFRSRKYSNDDILIFISLLLSLENVSDCSLSEKKRVKDNNYERSVDFYQSKKKARFVKYVKSLMDFQCRPN